MNKRNYKEKLKNCAKNAVVPDVLHEVKQADFSAYRENEQTARRRSPLKRKLLLAVFAAAVFILVFAFAVMPQLTFDQTISATVSVNINEITNYSIELNKNSQFIEITADNEAGKEVLKNLSFGRKKIDVVLTELLKACVDRWNLTEEQLSGKTEFSVTCGSGTQKADLEKCCNNSMNAAKQHCRNRHGH